ncbi:MAG: DNA-processing protein DprA [Candidatus Margulisiibacteriota bacterium]
MKQDNDRLYWPALASLQLGAVTLKRALERFGSPQAVWEAPVSAFNEIKAIRETSLEKIRGERNAIDPEAELNKLEKAKVNFVTLFDDNYPALLKEIYDPPVVLFYKGLKPERSRRRFAIVGTRHPSQYGISVTSKLSADLVNAGFTIVSGLARGIDTETHKSTLLAGGKTIAVLGCGLDVVYPAENHELYERICENGTIFSEFPLGTQPLVENFPCRNRIITGLCSGTLVVQCAIKSGAMISARYALEQNREVFAVPGNIEQPQSAGPHLLLQQGAKLVGKVEDILEELNICTQGELFPYAPAQYILDEQERQVHDLLSAEPFHFDILANRSRIPLPKLAEIMINLELKNAVMALPGKYYIKK